MTAPRATESLSDEAYDLLHELRLRGFRAGIGTAVEGQVLRAGLAVRRGPNLGLTPWGRTVHAAWARLPAGSPEEVVAQAIYRRFLPLNAELLGICTAWQLRYSAPNDHSDPAYDHCVLERLDRLHRRIAPLVGELAAAVARFSAYPERLAAARRRIDGDRQWLASPRCDSYHTVWMQLHEDLLTAIGADRRDEPEPE